MTPEAAALLAFGIAVVACPVAVVLLRRRQLLDHPNERSSHDSPTPRGAGVALALAAVPAVAVAGTVDGRLRTGILVSAIGFALIGLAEDMRGVEPVRRLLLQVVAAALAVLLLVDWVAGSFAWRVVFAAGCLIWLVACVNAFNFMDGINGLAAAHALTAGAVWWAVGHTEDVTSLAAGGAILVALAVAFLPFNYPTARVFLGDVGSYLLGGLLGAMVIAGLRAGLPPECVLAPLAVTLADTGSTLVRRFRAGEPVLQPHRSHAYQRLVALGWSHGRTTAFVTGAMALCSLLGAAALSGSTMTRILADAMLAAVLTLYVQSPVLLSRRRTEVFARQPA